MPRRKKTVQEAVDAVAEGEGDQVVEQPVVETQPQVEEPQPQVEPQPEPQKVIAGPEAQPLVPVKPTIDLPTGTEFRRKTKEERRAIAEQQRPMMEEYYKNPVPIKRPHEKRFT